MSSIAQFHIDYQGRTYACHRIDSPNGVLYRVDFPDACLYLTQATTADGTRFWTPVPEDRKRQSLARALGAIIEQTRLSHETASVCVQRQGDLFTES